MDDSERLEAIFEVLERLSETCVNRVVLVEGIRDREALEYAGIVGDFFSVQSSGGPVKAAEYAWRSGKEAIILTDWDRKGGILAKRLAENLESLGVRYDMSVRKELAVLCRPYSKDVESLGSVIDFLRGQLRKLKRPLVLRRKDGFFHRVRRD